MSAHDYFVTVMAGVAVFAMVASVVNLYGAAKEMIAHRRPR